MKDKILDVLYSHSHASDEFGSPIMDNFEDVASAIMEVLNGEKWVKVEDGLPPEGKMVLVCPKDNEHCLISMAELQKGVWYNADWFKNMPLEAYPFWMPLPPLPTPPTQQP